MREMRAMKNIYKNVENGICFEWKEIYDERPDT